VWRITVKAMATITFPSDEAIEEALRGLTADGTDQEEAIRQAILEYWRDKKDQAPPR
jgi:hypothetical protein